MLGIFARSFYIATRRGEIPRWGMDHWREAEKTGLFDPRDRALPHRGERR